jgi:hypothetical protein
MAKEIDDLDILFPETAKSKSFTAKDGKKYSVNFFINAETALVEKREDEPSIEYQIRLLAVFLGAQHEHMNEEWIRKNLPLQYMNYLFNKILASSMKSNRLLGEDLEAAMPEKKPGEEDG